jgi:two-component system sensor histidine kinase KdpD
VFVRERRLSRAERELVEERVLAAALSNRLHEMSALTDAGRAVSSSLSQEQVFQVILDSVHELLGATEASVMLFDSETGVLRLVASRGLDEQAAQEGVAMMGEGVAGLVARSLEPVVLRGDLRDEQLPGFVGKDRPASSAMSAPLRMGGDLIGVLNVSVSGDGRVYTDHDLRALTVFAEQAAAAIANARLFEQERRTSSELAELERQRRDFLATITHDLKTPLTSILGYVKLLRRAGENLTSEQAATFTDVIERQGKRILEMVQQLVEVTRLEEGPPALARELLDLALIVDEQVLAVGGMLGGRRLDVNMPSQLPETFGDRNAVEHILMNLLENAVKYTKDGDLIEVAVTPGDGEVRISVTDEGPGIPEGDLPKVFERYRQASGDSAKGSVGLGLYIVRSLTQAHGGRVWAENVPGKGARITFTLPVRTAREG